MCDHVAGEIAAGAILASLFERERSGVGAEIEVPMYETMSAFVLQEHLAAQSFVPGLAGPGDRRVLSASNRPVKTADGWLSLTTNTDKQSRALLSAIGRDDLADDPRFSTVAARIRNIDEWLQLRNDAIKSRTTEEWLQILHELDIPCMPCHSLESMLGDPHLSAVGLLQQTEHSVEGTVVQVRPTILTNGSHADPGSPAVPVGWNTREILEEIGLHHDEVNELIASGAALDGRRDGN
jgi:crotonobetainyl-CoA:carnitine CoA-transferase CaiB-like acyl-CoA transferase